MGRLTLRVGVRAAVCLLCTCLLLPGTVLAFDALKGDLAPRGIPDGQLDAGDLLVLQRIVQRETDPCVLDATGYECLVGDVAPNGVGNGEINAGDLLVLQRAVLSGLALGNVDVPLDAPVLDPSGGLTIDNPFAVTGSAMTGVTGVEVTVDGEVQGMAAPNADGSFSFDAILDDGNNTVTIRAYAGGEYSAVVGPIVVDYQNTLPRNHASPVVGDGGLVVWTRGNGDPYHVTGDMSIEAGGRFVIQPGADVRFDGGGLDVAGELSVRGESLDPVLLSDDGGGSWSGIGVDGDAIAVIDHAVISNANAGVEFRNSSVDDAGACTSLCVRDSVISGGQYGVWIEHASPTLLGNTLHTNQFHGIYMAGLSNPLITGFNQVYGNGAGGNAGILVSGQGGNPAPVINGNSIHDNGHVNEEINLEALFFSDPHLVRLDARNNWWGTTLLKEITATVHDYGWQKLVSSSRPMVDFGNPLDAESGSPLAGNYLPAVLDASVALVSGTTYEVLNWLVVRDGDIGSIPAGVTLRFHDDRFTVDGQLVVAGTPTEPVVMESGITLPTLVNWGGITVSGNGSAVIEGAHVHQASAGIRFFDTSLADDGSCSVQCVSNSVVEDNAAEGVSVSNSTPTITGSQLLSNNTGISIVGQSQVRVINGNTIAGNVTGVQVNTSGGFNPAPVVSGNSIHSNTHRNYNVVSFVAPTNVELDATYNWWGSSDPSVIGVSINDFTDNPGLPVVNYGSYLLSEGGSPAPGNFISGTIDAGTTFVAGESYSALGTLRVESGVTATVDAGAVLQFFDEGDLDVDGTLEIESGASLVFGQNSSRLLVDGEVTLGAGAELRFGGAGVFVQGVLNATGQALAPVVLGGSSSGPSSWPGIVVLPGAGAVNLDHVVIEDAGTAVSVSNDDFSLTNSVVKDSAYGVLLNGVDSALVDGTFFSIAPGNPVYGLQANASTVTVNESVFTGSSYGVEVRPFSAVLLTGNTLSGTYIGVYVEGVGTDTSNPAVVMSGNDIHSNSWGGLAVLNYGAGTLMQVDAENNWWGSATPTIGAWGQSGVDISVGINGTPISVVDFDPALGAAVTGAHVTAVSVSERVVNPDGAVPSTSIDFTLDVAAPWTLNIVDQSGLIVRAVTGSSATPSFVWDGKDAGATAVAVGRYRALLLLDSPERPQLQGVEEIDVE